MKLLTFISYYEGEFGDLEGPQTYIIGVFDNDTAIEKAKRESGYVEEDFLAQFGSAKNKFIVTDVLLNISLVKNRKSVKTQWTQELQDQLDADNSLTN